MSNMTESRLGLNVGGSDKFELFLKTFSGEVLAAFEARNVMMPLHTVRTISSGKSAQFPLTGTATAGYHVPGDEILGTVLAHSERIINIDNLLIASAFIANIDEAMNHYDVRSVYAQELGYALATHADKACIRSAIAGSLDTTDVLGSTSAGSTIATGGVTGDDIIDGILDAAKAMDENDIPMGDRHCVLTPTSFYNVLKAAGGADTAAAVLNKDYGPGASVLQGGGQIIRVGGVDCYMSNHIPTTDEGTASGALGDGTDGTRNDPFVDAGATGAAAAEGYSGVNFTNYQGVVFHRSGVGTVKLMDLAIESDYLVQNQGTLMVAKYAMGHNYLRAGACVGLKTS